MIEEFKKQYHEKVILGDGFDDELNRLFDQVLMDEFDDDPERMSAFIESIVEEFNPSIPQPSVDELQEQIDSLEMMINQLQMT